MSLISVAAMIVRSLVVLLVVTIVCEAFFETGFPAFVDKMSASARVLTAISLSSGLADKSIPLDEALTEMLNIQGVGMAEVGKFDKAAINNFLGKLETSSGQMDGSVANVESAVIGMNEILESWLKIKESLRSVSSDISLLQSLKSADLSALEKMDPSNSDAVKRAMESVGSVKFDELNNFISSMEPWVLASDTFVYCDKFDSTPLSVLKPGDKKKAKSNMDSVGKLSSSSSVPLKVLKAVASSRFSHPAKKHTAGFANGADDLVLFTSSDYSSSWISKTFEAVQLGETLSSLSPFGSKLSQISKTWQSLNVYYTSILRIEEIQKMLTAAAGNVQVDGIFDSLLNCLAEKRSVGVTTQIKEVADDVENLKTKVAVLSTIHRLATSSEAGGDSIQMLTLLLKVFRGGKKIGTSISDLTSKKDFMQGISSNIIFSNYVKFFDCMEKIGPEFSAMVGSMKAAKAIRALKSSETLKQTREATSMIADSIPTLNEVQSSTFSKSSEGLDGIQMKSKGFGDAVAAVVSVQKTLLRNAAMQKLVSSGSQMKREIRIKNYDEKLEVLSRWSSFEEETLKLAGLMGKVDSATSKIGASPDEGASFADFSLLFSAFNGLETVDLGVDEKLLSIDKMATSSPLIGGVKKSLMEIAEIDLQFSKFSSSLSGIPSILQSIDEMLTAGGLDSKKSKSSDESSGIPIVLIICLVIGLVLAAAAGFFIFKKVTGSAKKDDKKQKKNGKKADEKKDAKKVSKDTVSKTKTSTDPTKTMSMTTSKTGSMSPAGKTPPADKKENIKVPPPSAPKRSGPVVGDDGMVSSGADSTIVDSVRKK